MQAIQNKSQRVGSTWGRTALIVTNIILTTIIIGMIIFAAVNFKNIVNKVVKISLDAVKNNKQIQPTLTDFATTTAINTLQDKKVRAQINNIVDTSLEPVQNDINKIIGTIPGAPIIPPTLPIPSRKKSNSVPKNLPTKIPSIPTTILPATISKIGSLF
jgi:hypothetical protein